MKLVNLAETTRWLASLEGRLEVLLEAEEEYPSDVVSRTNNPENPNDEDYPTASWTTRNGFTNRSNWSGEMLKGDDKGDTYAVYKAKQAGTYDWKNKKILTPEQIESRDASNRRHDPSYTYRSHGDRVGRQLGGAPREEIRHDDISQEEFYETSSLRGRRV